MGQNMDYTSSNKAHSVIQDKAAPSISIGSIGREEVKINNFHKLHHNLCNASPSDERKKTCLFVRLTITASLKWY